MGVVYFSIIPTFEPSRYCKCWIVCFYYRKLVEKPDANEGKVLLVKELQKKCNLNKNTARCEQKFNLFIWKPRM